MGNIQNYLVDPSMCSLLSVIVDEHECPNYRVIVPVRISSMSQIDPFDIIFKIILNYINKVAFKTLIL